MRPRFPRSWYRGRPVCLLFAVAAAQGQAKVRFASAAKGRNALSCSTICRSQASRTTGRVPIACPKARLTDRAPRVPSRLAPIFPKNAREIVRIEASFPSKCRTGRRGAALAQPRDRSARTGGGFGRHSRCWRRAVSRRLGTCSARALDYRCGYGAGSAARGARNLGLRGAISRARSVRGAHRGAGEASWLTHAFRYRSGLLEPR